MDNKKDLTRIEDLGEFLHELDDTENYLDLPALPDENNELPPDDMPALPDEEAPAFSEEAPTELPDIPAEEEAPAFGSSDDSPFTTEEAPVETDNFAFSEEAPTEESSDFGFTNDEPVEEDNTFSVSEETPLDDSDVLNAVSDSITEASNEQDEPFATTSDSDFGPSESDPAPEPESFESTPVEEVEAEPEPLKPIEQEYTPKEDFTETRNFAEKAVLDDSPAECNPAYSVIARNIRFLEDSEEILSLLKEVGFPHDMMEQYKRQIERGTLLIPRVSEFTALYVSHRLRRFRLELQMGLSDSLHPPKKGRDSDKGLVSRKSLGQNQHHAFQFKGDSDGARHIILSTLPQLDGHAVDRYVGVASEHTFLEAEAVENETSEAIHKTYDELAQKLKGHALHHKANAVLGINYQLTPMPTEGALGHYRYKLTCTGNLVWVHKLSV